MKDNCVMQEIITIKGFENYGVTVNGQVFNIITHKELKPWIGGNGYFYVRLCNQEEKKKFRVNRLVAEAFIPNPLNLPCVNHKDENKTNNNVENLEWCSHRYNIMYGKNAPANNIRLAHERNKKNVVQCDLNGTKIKRFESIKEAAYFLGIAASGISRCLAGSRRTAGGFKWEYE